MVYEWNSAKAKTNLNEHGVSFEEATTAFLDPFALTFNDPDHSDDETREITIGSTVSQQVVFVSHCARGDRTRIISARKSTRNERKQYEEGISKRTR